MAYLLLVAYVFLTACLTSDTSSSDSVSLVSVDEETERDTVDEEMEGNKLLEEQHVAW